MNPGEKIKEWADRTKQFYLEVRSEMRKVSWPGRQEVFSTTLIVIAAVLLPLYFVADTGLTIVRRARAGERLSVAHRTHFYQRARDNGFTNMQIVGRVLAVNIGLVVLAALSVVAHAPLSSVLALLAGCGLVAWLMIGFASPRATGDV